MQNKFFKQFENIRHGEKQGDQLSEIGVEQSQKKAQELLEEIRSLPMGTVFYIMTSNIGRAVDTMSAIEKELIGLAKKDSDIEFISVQNREQIQQSKDEFTKKYVITDIPPTHALGFSNKPYVPAVLKYKKLYQGDENLVGKTWVAKHEELASLKTDLKERFPGLDIESINPKEFTETPEQAALRYIQLMKRMAKITEKYFPGHPWKNLQVGHNLLADFATLALLNREISIKSIDEIGGKFRDFMESATFEIRGEEILVKFRGEENVQVKNLEKIITELKERSDRRRKSWEESHS